MAERREQIDEYLATLVKELESVHVTDNFPQDLEPAELKNVQNAALDFCTAICDFLSAAIKSVASSDKCKRF